MKHLIDCAAGRIKCNLLIKNARIFNVFTGELEEGDIAIADGKIAGIGKGYSAEKEYDAQGKIAIPGLIDSHIHVESSLLSPEAFAAASVPHGTSAIVADPHEIVNVCGIEGAEYMKEAFSRLSVDGVQPLEVLLQLPSCVPATPFETSGAVISGEETEREIKRDLFFGLGEMMNFPGVIYGDEDTLKKLKATHAQNKPIDGHAPAVTGQTLNAYLCGGILTDHETLALDECKEKIARGVYIQLRKGSSCNNISETGKAVTPFNFRRFLLCSDDKNARDLQRVGHLDDALRYLVSVGIPAEEAVCMATINAAQCYSVKGKGALAPSYDADVILVDSLKDFHVSAVFKAGVLVAENGKPLFAYDKRYLPDAVKSSVRVKPVTADSFRLDLTGKKARVMKVYSCNDLVTREEITPVKMKDGDVVLEGDIAKLAVLERHFATGNMGLTLARGYGLTRGALAISVAHDSHNLVVLGKNNTDMAKAVQLLQQSGGGMALADGEHTEVFPLDIAGLMSSAPLEEVVSRTAEITRHARELGVPEGIEPFMTLAFLSLAVIPKLKLTDKGLVDVEKFEFVSVGVDE